MYALYASPDGESTIGRVHSATLIAGVHAYVDSPLFSRWQLVNCAVGARAEVGV